MGLLFLAACVGAAEMITHMNDETLGQVVKESLTIGGWVAMWRPLEIYLYDWWPIRDERLNFGRLSRMRVRIEIGPGEKPARNA